MMFWFVITIYESLKRSFINEVQKVSINIEVNSLAHEFLRDKITYYGVLPALLLVTI